MPSKLTRQFHPWPKSTEELLSNLRVWLDDSRVSEILLQPGKSVLVVSALQDSEGQDQLQQVDVTPYDILMQGELLELSVDPTSPPVTQLAELFEAVISLGKWPKCFLVHDAPAFLSWLGFSGVRLTVPNVFGYPVHQDNRMVDDVVVLGATPEYEGGYGTLSYGAFIRLPEPLRRTATPILKAKDIFSRPKMSKEGVNQ